MREALPLVETDVVPKFIVTDLAEVEHVGDGLFRFVLAAKYETLASGLLVYKPELEIFMPASGALRASMRALKAVGTRCCGRFDLTDRCQLH